MESEAMDKSGCINNSEEADDSMKTSFPMKPGVKRTHEDDNNKSTLPAKKIALLKPNLPKNALCLLHELYRGLEYKIVNQEGPQNAPIFTASIAINGIIFEGKGRNKKAAKHTAAESALRSMVQFKNPTSEGPNMCITNELMDFSNDVQDREINNFDASKASGSNITIPNGSGEKNGLLVGKNNLRNLKLPVMDKNPVMLLNEIHPTAEFKVESTNSKQCKKYTTSIVINGQKFEGTGTSKKLSKAAAARSALLTCYNVSIPARPTLEPGKSFCVDSANGSDIPQLFSDHIAKLINEKYMSLMEDDLLHVRRKVLAGFVMSKGYDLNSCKVITVSTGTKCINGERMSSNGSVLNDSHAEIISRRCLCKFFYLELEKHLSDETKNESIFLRNESGFYVDPQYKFYLYINSAPCGDSSQQLYNLANLLAVKECLTHGHSGQKESCKQFFIYFFMMTRMFSPYEECVVDRHPNRRARGQLRTKIECGEGTIPVKSSDVVQTWDGVLQGERLLTMSCSDKIAKWNVVGLQGALLANFIQPVYLDGIILGSLFHPSHLYRAVAGRIENTISGLPPPYRLNKPKLSTILNTEIRQIGKSPNFSVNWTLGDSEAEIVNAVSGKTELNQVSQLSKCWLFYRFLRLVGKIPAISDFNSTNKVHMYSQSKQRASSFQVAKLELFKAFSRANLGEWVKKPVDVDQFEWDEESLTKFLFSNSFEGSIS